MSKSPRFFSTELAFYEIRGRTPNSPELGVRPRICLRHSPCIEYEVNLDFLRRVAMRRVFLAFIFIVACSAIGSAQQYTFYFPHIANGTYPGGSWKTTIFITNSSGSTASGAITFNADG